MRLPAVAPAIVYDPSGNMTNQAQDVAPAAGFARRLRARVEGEVMGVLSGPGGPGIDFLHPAGDPGLFGPDAACWLVHSDFTGMMVGGISALLLQMLHPLALAGVVDHSNFREDMMGRLRRTATFVAGTTYGPRAAAEDLIDRVRTVHKRVVGRAPDGRPYSADDPELLTWIHVAEMDSFLRGYLTYVDAGFPEPMQDRYFEETAVIAEKLGARDVPKSRAAVLGYMERVRPLLAVTERTREVAALVVGAPAPSRGAWPIGKLFMAAGIELLPGWAQALTGTDMLAGLRGPAVRAGVRSVAPLLRWSMRDGVAAKARRRCGS